MEMVIGGGDWRLSLDLQVGGCGGIGSPKVKKKNGITPLTK